MQNSVVTEREKSELKVQNKFLVRVYLWMTIALFISGTVAFYVSQSEMLLKLIFGNSFGFIAICVLEIILVGILSFRINKMSAFGATIGFIVYSILNGATLSSIFIIFEVKTLFLVFFISSGMFLMMVLYGSFTKSKLNSFGRYFTMALIGVIIASLVNLFLKSSMLDWILSLITVVIFTGLTAYDAQKMMKASETADGKSDEVFKKASILGALELYLDFINIFLSMLRIFGKKR